MVKDSGQITSQVLKAQLLKCLSSSRKIAMFCSVAHQLLLRLAETKKETIYSSHPFYPFSGAFAVSFREGTLVSHIVIAMAGKSSVKLPRKD